MRMLLFVLALPVLAVMALIGVALTPLAALLALAVPGLTVLHRTSCPRTFNLLAYHSPHSLTWSWILSAQFDRMSRAGDGRFRFALHPYRTNQGLQIVLVLPWLCLQWHRQQPMFYRDMWRRQRDLADGLT